jgi:hypothetical protein
MVQKHKRQMTTENNLKYICLSTVKNDYKLNEQDIEELECTYVRNPHYRSAPHMRLYVEEEIKKISKEKNKRILYEQEHAEEILAEKIAKKIAEKKEHSQKAKDIVKNFKSKNIDINYGSTNLPNEVIMIIMEKLAQSYEYEGIRSPYIVTQDIINMTLVCKDFYNTLQFGLKTLSNLIPTKYIYAIDIFSEFDWDKFVSNPNSFTLVLLKQAARILDIKIGGTKAEVILRILEQFGLEKPINCPALLVCALQKENISKLRHTLEIMVNTMNRNGHCIYIPYTNAKQSHKILVDKFGNYENMKKEYRVCEIEDIKTRERVYEEEERKKAIILAEKIERLQRLNVMICNCGQIIAKDCVVGLCGACCRKQNIRCLRHRH